MQKKTTLLLILDGWGQRKNQDYNAILEANTPNWDKLFNENPHTTLKAHGLLVGLPNDQMGNSEVGHTNIGAGRIVYQTLTLINLDITNNKFAKNPALQKCFNQTKSSNGCLHIFILLSDGGVHSHQDHLFETIKIASKTNLKLKLHLFTDGRDTPPNSGIKYANQLINFLTHYQDVKIATVSGRYYAMDRDKNWNRIEKTYKAIVNAKAPFIANNLNDAINNAYLRKETDEFIQPTIIEDYHGINEKDGILFLNFRADRANQLTTTFIDENFKEFKVSTRFNNFTSLTKYNKLLNSSQVMYNKQPIINGLGEYLAQKDKTQLRIAETEKYAHVTFFFNGGREDVFKYETRILIPSPKVTTYDLQPEMSVYKVSRQVIQAIMNNKYDLIVCNFANPDMVGHTGVYKATKQAIEAVDKCLGDIILALKTTKSEAIITADHGNAEEMWDYKQNLPLTSHTYNRVPLVYFGEKKLSLSQDKKNSLANIAPTILDIMNIEKPNEMTASKIIINK